EKGGFSNDTTLLCEAASKGQLEIVKLLLNAGADINSLDFYNKTPLFNAILNNHTAVGEFLIAQGGNFNGADVKYDLEGFLWQAVENRRIEVVKLLIASGVSPNPTRLIGSDYTSLLHLAIEKEYMEIVKLLVKAGADIEKREQGITPLQRAEKKKH